MIRLILVIAVAILCIYPNCLNAGNRIIVDTEGREVKIPEKIQRVVVLSGTCIETIYILGAIDKVVGVSKAIKDSQLLPVLIPQLKKIPVVAQSTAVVNLEAILAVKPDILITMGPEHTIVGMNKQTVERIEGYGIPVILMNLKSLEENYYSIELLGRIFHNEKKAMELTRYMKTIVSEIQRKLEKIPPSKRVKALYISGNNPNFIAGGYWGDQDIRVLAGGINVASEIPQFMATVSSEQISLWNPDVITISAAAKYSAKEIFDNPHFKNINAVKNKQVFKHPYHIAGLFTPRVVLLLAWHASKFYPELNINWVGIADSFYKKFYGMSYYGPKE